MTGLPFILEKSRVCSEKKVLRNIINMTDNTEVENSETSGTIKESGVDVSEILTDGFMESFLPSLENLQDRLGELT